MIGYKLLRVRKNGTLGPLFIHRRLIITTGQWLDAEAHPTTGFAIRPGFHACLQPSAPHLRQGGDRVWARVELDGTTLFNRPAAQGGTWVLAKRMRVLEVLRVTPMSP